MATPRVSIGMTVDNGAAHLEVAIDGMLAQTFGDFELILSDDGSTDASESICRAYAARDRRIRYYREEEHRGPFWNTNRVFELSRGAYFRCTTYDDVCAPTFLARCVELLDGDASLAWCHTLTSHIDASGRVLPAADDPAIPEGQAAFSLVATGPGLPRHTRRSTLPHERFHGVVLGTNWCSDGYGLFRSEAVRRTRLLQSCHGAGKVLIAEVALQGRFEEVPEVLFFDILHERQALGVLVALLGRRDEDQGGGPGLPRHQRLVPQVRPAAGPHPVEGAVLVLLAGLEAHGQHHLAGHVHAAVIVVVEGLGPDSVAREDQRAREASGRREAERREVAPHHARAPALRAGPAPAEAVGVAEADAGLGLERLAMAEAGVGQPQQAELLLQVEGGPLQAPGADAPPLHGVVGQHADHALEAAGGVDGIPGGRTRAGGHRRRAEHRQARDAQKRADDGSQHDPPRRAPLQVFPQPPGAAERGA